MCAKTSGYKKRGRGSIAVGTSGGRLLHSMAKFGAKKGKNMITKVFNRWKKRGGSRTKSKGPQERIQGDDIHSGGAERRVKIILPSARGKKSGRAPLQLYYGYSGNTRSYAGLQACDYWVQSGTASQFLLAGTGQIGSPPVGFFSLNPNQKETGSSVWATGIAISDKITHIRTCLTMDVTNFSSIVQYYTVFVAECIKPTDTGPLDMWAKSLLNQSDGTQVAEVVPPGGSTSGTLGTPIVNHVGVRPTYGGLFNQFYRIRRAMNVVLAGGATEKIICDIEKHRSYTKEYIQRLYDEGSTTVPGSIHVFTICHGQPVQDRTVDGSRKVTYGYVDYGFVCNVRESFVAGSYQRRARMNLALTGYPTLSDTTKLYQVDVADVVSAMDTV